MVKSPKDISDWMASYIADLIGTTVDDIDRDIEFSAFGLDSSAVISMTGDLSDWLGAEVDPTIVYEFSSIRSLSDNVTSDLKSIA